MTCLRSQLHSARIRVGTKVFRFSEQCPLKYKPSKLYGMTGRLNYTKMHSNRTCGSIIQSAIIQTYLTYITPVHSEVFHSLEQALHQVPTGKNQRTTNPNTSPYRGSIMLGHLLQGLPIQKSI